MTKLDDYSQASRLAFAHMKPGVLTNHVMTADEYRAEIANGTLFAHEWGGGVLFLRKRETYHLLSFYVNDLGALPEIKLPEDTFAEIAYKPAGAENVGRVVAFWERVGFKPVFERVRLTRTAGSSLLKSDLLQAQYDAIQSVGDDVGIAPYERCEHPSPLRIAIAGAQDINTCHELMRTNFDSLTGHLPEKYEIRDSVAAGCILCLKDTQGDVCGLLRWGPRAASVEIRQLALREDMRGQGLARCLLDTFIAKCGDRKNIVWVRDGYVPALKSYAAVGFAADGWRSTVLCL